MPRRESRVKKIFLVHGEPEVAAIFQEKLKEQGMHQVEYPEWRQSRRNLGVIGIILASGEVPEWPNGAVSKTVVALVVTVGSNPTLSAISLHITVGPQ